MFNHYIPKKSDQIDGKLAEFINQYPEKEKMRIMFLRESEGVYRFGTRKVYVKIENEDKSTETPFTIFRRRMSGFTWSRL